MGTLRCCEASQPVQGTMQTWCVGHDIRTDEAQSLEAGPSPAAAATASEACGRRARA